MNDLLDAFPYDNAAIYVAPDDKARLVSLLIELNFDVGGRTLVNSLHNAPDLVIVLPGAFEPLPTNLAVVVSINSGDAAKERFPVPNVTKGASEYRDKIVRFLSAKKRCVMHCPSSRSVHD